MKAEDIMSRQVYDVMESDDINQAFSKFRQHRVNQLLVVNVESQLCGMVSDRDILRAWAEVANSDRHYPRVASVMKRDVITCGPQDGITHVTAMMLENRVHAIPVLGSTGRAIGIITSTDLLRFGLKNLSFSRLQPLPAMI